MSYCRFSSDNWKSNVYAYESVEGFEVYVASHRIVDELPPLLKYSEETKDAFFDRYEE